MKKYIIKTEGMMCGHCESTVEKALSSISGVHKARANHSSGSVKITADDEVSLNDLSAAVNNTGYKTLSAEEYNENSAEASEKKNIWPYIFTGIIAAGLFYFLKNHSSAFIPNEIPTGVSLGALFVIGFFTSFHCLAMCGGIELSQCIGVKNSQSIIPAVLYNSGRIISYTVAGALVGGIGSVFSFSPSIRGLIMFAAAVFMIIMGLKIFGINLPFRIAVFDAFSRKISLLGRGSPFAVGLLNVFIPCGPLQAMQLYALGTGSIASGALSMLFFSAGTAPLMFFLGAAGSFLSRKQTKIIYQAGGIAVIILAIAMLINSISILGAPVSSGNASKSSLSSGEQIAVSNVSSSGYENVILRKGIPAKIIFRVSESDLNGCNNAIIIPSLGIEKRLVPGDNIIRFTPSKSGTIPFSCWMGMIRANIIVTDENDKINSQTPTGNDGLKGCCAGAEKINQSRSTK